VSSANGMLFVGSSGSAGFHNIEDLSASDGGGGFGDKEDEMSDACSRETWVSWPEYVVVYVQSYGLVATVLGIGVVENGSVLRRGALSTTHLRTSWI